MVGEYHQLRILFITSEYPISAGDGGGYAQLCEEVASGLFGRGHTVKVLTAKKQVNTGTTYPYPVYRLLHLEPNWSSNQSATQQFFIGRRQREAEALAHLQRLVTDFKPDVVFVWHIIGLPRILFKWLEQEPKLAVVYYLADYTLEIADEYISYWLASPKNWAAKVFKKPLAAVAIRQLREEGKPISLKYKNVICVSEYVRQRLVSKRIIPYTARVIRNGIDLERFSADSDQSPDFAQGLNCLIAGRVDPVKGIHTVIDALALIKEKARTHPVTLTVLGSGPTDYHDHLRKKVSDYQLNDVVSFRAAVPREQIPNEMRRHNSLILASEWAEPLARSVQEAMAMGLLVMGTNTGGSGELLVHQKTGLVFKAGDPDSLADQFIRALEEPQLVEKLAKAGQGEVKENFSIERTVTQIENYLLKIENLNLQIERPHS